MRVSLAFVVASLLWMGQPGAARAQPVWQYYAECVEGSETTDLSVWCDQDFDCVRRAQVLYACGSPCVGPHLLVSGTQWREDDCICRCSQGFAEFSCKDDPICEVGDTYTCHHEARITVPYSCDELGYESICLTEQCPAGDPLEGCTGADCQCGDLVLRQGWDPATAGCADPPSGTSSSGCSVATAPGAGGATLPVLLLLLLWARRRRR